MDVIQKLLQPNVNMQSIINVNVNENKQYENTNTITNTITNNNIFCVNCGNQGHIFKYCKLPVCSYGLICFYKKKTMVKETPIVNNIFNRKTKKTEYSSRSKNNKNNNFNKYNNFNANVMNNMSRIKILKRHESISYTLKNMLGVVGGNSDDQEAIDGILDTQEVEEIIDIDGEYSNCENGDNCISGEHCGSGENSGICENSGNGDSQNECSNVMKEVMINKILLVQRRNTIGMIEFIRGKYDVTDFDYIVKLFNMMTFDEKRILRQHDSFDMIRTVIGLKREYNYKSEYDDAKNKFIILKQNINGDKVNALLDKSYTKWSSPEWGIPKGRRNNKEYDIECAIREFVEETGIKYKNINVYRNIKPVEEIYTGINGVVYKHIYFIADIKDTTEANENVTRVEKGGFLNYEISNIKLFSLTEAHKLIRPYYVSKLNAIKKGFEIIESINTFFE
jgi:8-oxo-dGTP pyrophosphatase MutT (NUDIX family)